MTYRKSAILGDWATSQAYWNSIPWWQKLSPIPAIKAAALLAQPAETQAQKDAKLGVTPLPLPVDQPSGMKIPWAPISVGAGLLVVAGGYFYYSKKHKKVLATI
jgi:hypothetical protein